MDTYVILKRFGILDVNKKVIGHKVTSDLWHILFLGEWHTVPIEDIEELNT